AYSRSGRAVVGTVISQTERTKASRNLILLEESWATTIRERPVTEEVDTAPELAAPLYGPPAPPYKDFQAWAPLAVAIDATGKTFAAADYQGWDRMLLPNDNGLSLGETKPRPMGIRFALARPAIS